MNVIKEDASLIQRFIDQENSSMLNFEEFLFALRGKPNEERQNAINYVFSIFDNGSGVADVNQMKQVFNCQRHPKFTMGKLNEDQMFYLYLKNFNNVVQPTVTKKVSFFFHFFLTFFSFFRNGIIIMLDYLLLLIMMLILSL